MGILNANIRYKNANISYKNAEFCCFKCQICFMKLPKILTPFLGFKRHNLSFIMPAFSVYEIDPRYISRNHQLGVKASVHLWVTYAMGPLSNYKSFFLTVLFEHLPHIVV